SRPRRSIEPGSDAGPRFDFEEVSAGPSLDLDLPPDEPLPRRSFTPPSVSVAPAAPERVSHPDLPVSQRVPVATTPHTPPAVPSLVPVVAVPATPEAPPRMSLQPTSADPAASRSSPSVAMPRVSVPSSPPTLARKLAPGVAMAVTSVLITLLDHVYASYSGEVFSIGPLRTTSIAALLLLGGIGLVALRLVEMRQDER
ncbi:MAG TPA: hypothetical protein VF103_07560, partial [Polyangiaceae bacterium]